jgi:Ser/Thr protein kinase RdoA (MazF antagonist)
MVAGDSRTALPWVESLVCEHWGFKATAQKLHTERDEQFLLRDEKHRTFIVKIGNPFEDPAVIDMQTQALLHLATVDPDLPTPRVGRTGRGDVSVSSDYDGKRPVVRLLTYLDGRMLSAAPRSTAQAATAGALLARLGLALRDFKHPADGRDLDWDLAHAARLAPLLDGVVDPQRRELTLRHVQRFVGETMPALASLRTQVVHGDFNPHNILVDAANSERITGVIDFGDMVRTQLVNDVAIGACYGVVTGSHPLQHPLAFVAGFHSVRALSPAELQLLPTLMAARLAATVAITEWRAQRFPANRAYITKNTGVAWQGLELLDGVNAAQARQAFACLASEDSRT